MNRLFEICFSPTWFSKMIHHFSYVAKNNRIAIKIMHIKVIFHLKKNLGLSSEHPRDELLFDQTTSLENNKKKNKIDELTFRHKHQQQLWQEITINIVVNKLNKLNI